MTSLFAIGRLDGGRPFQLPLFLIWLRLLPLLLLALPFLMLLALAAPVRTWRGARALLSLLSAMRGLRAEMSAPHRSLLTHV